MASSLKKETTSVLASNSNKFKVKREVKRGSYKKLQDNPDHDIQLVRYAGNNRTIILSDNIRSIGHNDSRIGINLLDKEERELTLFLGIEAISRIINVRMDQAEKNERRIRNLEVNFKSWKEVKEEEIASRKRKENGRGKSL